MDQNWLSMLADGYFTRCYTSLYTFLIFFTVNGYLMIDHLEKKFKILLI